MDYIFSGLLLGLIVILYWVIPPNYSERRVELIIAFSIICLINISLLSFGFYLLLLAFIYIFAFWLERTKVELTRRRAFMLVPIILFGSMIFYDLSVTFQMNRFGHTVLAMVAFSYMIIRLYSFLDDVYRQRETVELRAFLAYTLFFPTFLIGPIESYGKFKVANFSKEFSLEYFYTFAIRFSWGVFLVYYLGEVIVGDLIQGVNYGERAWVSEESDGLNIYLFFLLKFVNLFFNFAGFTSIAISLAALFGYKAFENFRWPLLATNPSDFWSRWHISLGRFVTRQVYFRLAMLTRRPMLSILLAFVGMGLWHHVTLGYFLWGLTHGLAVVLFSMFKRKYAKALKTLSPLKSSILKFFGWAFTLSWVSSVSAMANAPDVAAFGNAFSRMIGLN